MSYRKQNPPRNRPATFGAQRQVEPQPAPQPVPQQRNGRVTVRSLQDQLARLQVQLEERTINQREVEPKEPKFRNFEGKEKEDPVAWYNDFKGLMKIYKMTAEHQYIFFRRHIVGEARNYIERLEQNSIDTVEKLAEALKSRFYEDLRVEDWRERLITLKMKEDETLQAFAGRTKITVSGAYPGLSPQQIEEIQLDYFLRGLSVDIRNSVRSLRPTTMNEAIDQAKFQSYLTNEGKPKKRKAESLSVMNETSEEPKEKVIVTGAKEVLNVSRVNKDPTASAFFALADVMKQNQAKLETQLKQINDKSRISHQEPNRKFRDNSHTNYQRNGKNFNNNDRRNYSQLQPQWNSLNRNSKQRTTGYPNRNNVGLSQGYSERGRSDIKPKRACYNCGSFDHLIAQCPKKNGVNHNHLNLN
jgi:hypothetical protein